MAKSLALQPAAALRLRAQQSDGGKIGIASAAEDTRDSQLEYSSCFWM